jgi:predicted amino acid racemase
MTARVTLSIDLEKITDNTRRVVDALGGLHVVGVTKVTGGTPEVGRAAGIAAPIWL